MAGHNITPYELTAVRKWAKKAETKGPMLLASLADKGSADLIQLIEDNILLTGDVASQDKTQRMRAAACKRVGDAVSIVMACDIRGEREVVHAVDDLTRPVFFKDAEKHVARVYATCLVYRPPDGDRGVLLLHSPWGRGGSKYRTLSLLQRAVNEGSGVRAKLHADPKVPQKELDRIIRKMNATKIEYVRRTGIRTTFKQSPHSAPAELSLVVKGSDTLGFRNALASALGSAAHKDEFFTIKVRDPDGDGYRDEEFDDVEIEVETGAGRKRYSLREESIPAVGFNKTPEINRVYYDLPEDQHDQWPDMLLAGVTPILMDVLAAVKD